MEPNTILMIAYGNSLRRDDGAGLVLGGQLAAAWQADGVALTLLKTHQLTPELALQIALPNVAAVLFIDTHDASQTEAVHQPLIQKLDIGPVSPSLGHQLHPVALCIYAHHLYNHQPPAWLSTVPGWDFAHGEGLSSRAQVAVAEAFHVVDRRCEDFLSG